MADLIRHKRSSVPSAVPAAGDLALGELAINVADGRLFLKKANGDMVDVTSIAGIIGLTEALAGKVNAGDVDFTIIYPNGGSEASPANVAINTRYVEANPFPGYRVICIAQMQYLGGWADIGLSGYASSQSAGIGVAQRGDGSIVVETGSHFLGTVTPYMPWAATTRSNLAAAAPCRVKVWKVKGAIV
ncbi:MAG: hypothetical protein ACN6P1_05610 [Pseudomonas sp.]|uniref:hypothetical protein n=1 Tax=Pseudomonas sp. TaxID=306 RepID=UPI003D0F978C